MKKNLYDLVGVPPQAPREMIGAACKRRIAKLEREGGEGAQAEIYAIREAWSILGDAGLRAGYDASLATAKPDAAAAPAVDPLVAHLAPAMLATELLKPRHLWSERWERWRKLVFVMLFVGLFALSAAWNQGNRTAKQKMLEAAEYEAEHGEPPPARKAEAAKPAAAATEEPFSAEKFERELKEREAAIQEQVAKEQTAKEDEFREKLQRENDPYASRRRVRTR